MTVCILLWFIFISPLKAGPLPNPALTPGTTLPVTTKEICVKDYASKTRNVPQSEKIEVFKRYNAKYVPGMYEVDHLIPLELGGSNNIENLWPQPWIPVPGAHEKDAVENYLHKKICAGKLALKEAQNLIASNWLVIWRQMQKSSAVKGNLNGKSKRRR